MKTRLKKSLSLILCIVLIAVMALITAGCNDNSKNTGGKESTTEIPQSGSEGQTTEGQSQSENNITVIGEGKTQFVFKVVDKSGNETKFRIHTDKETVGEALFENNLLEGENDKYGLYVKKVNGISADYDKDGVYWAFYVNGKYAMSGVDTTKIEEGNEYTFKVEK